MKRSEFSRDMSIYGAIYFISLIVCVIRNMIETFAKFYLMV